MTDEHEALLSAVRAVDRLNSWVRAPGDKGSNAKPMTYHLKNLALKALHAAGLTTHRPIRVYVKCRDCDGSGRYWHWCGEQLDHCWACNSTGKAALTFVETTIEAAGLRWHSPWTSFPLSTHGIEYPTQATPTDWQPNLPGKAMEPWEVAAAFCEAERAFPEKPYPRHTDYGTYHIDQYHLFVGRLPQDVCAICGEPAGEKPISYHCSRGRLEWCGAACEACEAVHKRTTQIFEAFPYPVELLRRREIVEWMNGHPVVERSLIA